MAYKRHDQINKGDIVTGAINGGWWRVTRVTVRGAWREFAVVNVDTGQTGTLGGQADEPRPVR